ncbi:MAG TPA: 5-bromo-4-chloroindolyl phosphate hydrolysis family protein [Candidatus Pelethomonas intestinigallinarum]|nr:5-bromo-4-chloroindolyl phosphate hydrolysis family protein [Candidatus Pelethomonas intestinigallinarum]
MATVKKIRRSVAPFYGVAAVWVVYALAFDLYRPTHFIFAAVLSAGVYLLLRAVCKDEEYEVEIPDPPKPEPASTGNPELDKMIRDGALAVEEMKRLDENIEDEKISQAIRELEQTSQAIFQQVREAPEKLPQIRKFMDYYLPTTLKLLNAYDRMSSVGVGGENIDGTKERVEAIMDTIVAAFDKQLDGLFGAEALDVSADITVLETMLAREGLAGDQMKAETTKNADGTDIKLEL